MNSSRQKQCGASLAATLQNKGRDDLAERGSVSRSRLIATDTLDMSRRWGAGKTAAGHRPALLWSAPAERGGDGAFALLRTAMETPSSEAPPPQNRKRRGASLPAALQNTGHDDLAERDSVSRSRLIATATQDVSRGCVPAKLLWVTDPCSFGVRRQSAAATALSLMSAAPIFVQGRFSAVQFPFFSLNSKHNKLISSWPATLPGSAAPDNRLP
jgi:hypothetical protein